MIDKITDKLLAETNWCSCGQNTMCCGVVDDNMVLWTGIIYCWKYLCILSESDKEENEWCQKTTEINGKNATARKQYRHK